MNYISADFQNTIAMSFSADYDTLNSLEVDMLLFAIARSFVLTHFYNDKPSIVSSKNLTKNTILFFFTSSRCRLTLYAVLGTHRCADLKNFFFCE